MKFSIELSAQDIDTVLAALNELPHKVARNLIDNILGQAKAQEAAQHQTPSEGAPA
jgi:hypothetical protein